MTVFCLWARSFLLVPKLKLRAIFSGSSAFRGDPLQQRPVKLFPGFEAWSLPTA